MRDVCIIVLFVLFWLRWITAIVRAAGLPQLEIEAMMWGNRFSGASSAAMYSGVLNNFLSTPRCCHVDELMMCTGLRLFAIISVDLKIGHSQ